MDEEAIFAAALQKASPEERAAFLDEACAGHPELRRGVELLLRAHERAGPFLAGVAADPSARVPRKVECPGAVIGPYRLVREIGAGGMGAVWLAEQQQPVQRTVALKVIKAGMDTAQVLARFEAERQALALMDHPNIARVLDAGTTDSGRPYFVMELIHGVPITRYCDEARLGVRERLALFEPVCQAVQHAHTKGVIHRDLKPSNVLVALYDGHPVPKVIDFGIAKAIGRPLTERTLVTEFGAIVGTLEYMSPEQAQLNRLDVDTRSDVYSLGVLLYELLTGTTPLDRERLKDGSVLEVLRLIREEEPPRPSARLSAAGGLADVAARRGLEPRKLAWAVRGELDWVVMRCLEKDRTRRYETASAVAADLGRYLADEPVEACPPSAVYRLRKLVRRHKRALATAALLGVMLVASVGAVAGIVGWTARDRAARRAKVHDGVQAALKDGADHADRALTLPEDPSQWEAALALASSALERAQTLSASEPGLLGEDWAERIEALADRLAVDRRDLLLVADVERIRLGETAANVKESRFTSGDTVPRYREAFRAYGVAAVTTPPREVAARLGGKHPAIRAALVAGLNSWLEATHRSAGAANEERLWLAAVLATADPGSLPDRMRAAALKRDVKALEALAAHPDAHRLPPATQHLIGNTLWAMGARPRAVAFLRQAQQHHPGDFWVNHCLADCLLRSGPPHRDEAATYYRVALGLRPKNAGVWLNLGNALRARGDRAGALAAYQKAVELAPGYALAHSNVGLIRHEANDWAGAVAAYRRALAIDPGLVETHSHLGAALLALGDRAGAVAACRKAVALDPKDAIGYLNLGAALKEQNDLPGAIAAYEKAIALAPKDAMARSLLGMSLHSAGDRARGLATLRRAITLEPTEARAYRNLAVVLHSQGKLAEAEAVCRKAVQLKPDFAAAHVTLAAVLADLTRFAESAKACQRAIDLEPGLAEAHANLGRALVELKQFAPAEAACRRAVRLRPDLAAAHNTLGIALAGQDRLADAVAALQRAILCQPDIAATYLNLGKIHARRKEWVEAEAAFRRYARLQPRAADAHLHLAAVQDVRGNLAGATAAYEEAVRLRPGWFEAHYYLGGARARSGQWPQAADVFGRAVGLNRENLSAWYCCAVARLRAGDVDGYRRACREMLERFGKSDDPEVAAVVAAGCLLAPSAGIDPQRIRPLADRAAAGIAKRGDARSFALVKALAEYRAGNGAAAVEWLGRVPANADGGSRDASTSALLALARHRLGQAAAARAALARARAILAKQPDPSRGRPFGNDWTDWLYAGMLSREAEGLLEAKERRPDTPDGQPRGR